MENVTAEMFDYINQQLDKIEKEYGVEILYCIEAGSRGWGFNNDESDYDVRFIFKRPLKDYLTINSKKDTIDYFDGELDFVGWDITKVLHLHWKSNPNLREWIKQKNVYRGDCDFLNNLPEFNKITLKYHYGSLAYNNWRRNVIGKENEMTKKVTKTYLYAIRCILAWIVLDDGNDAPIEIDELMKYFIDDDRMGTRLFADILMLISYYKSNCEKSKPDERGIENITHFIVTYLEILKADKPKIEELPDIEIFNKRLREILL
ncbi:DNA polymerase beta superfamily protein [uncultured Methanobrevibacter sp.]|uniref:nucleotidyltransferase domain-containing protein n=1 Tax=uncultured Methanobrevibacter sp. TaxID=253161 RepID=UPI00261AA6DA|nr:nucleotidyltransferase domain-containing protein [uncultured Methanobrevibacter sp.]